MYTTKVTRGIKFIFYLSSDFKVNYIFEMMTYIDMSSLHKNSAQ